MSRRSRTKVPVNLIPPKRWKNNISKQIEDSVTKPEKAQNGKMYTGNAKLEDLTTGTTINIMEKESSSTKV